MRKAGQILSGGEYVISDGRITSQVARARWEFIQALQQKVPAFAQSLRADVYPEYARLARNNRTYSRPGWTCSTWRLKSDPQNLLSPHILAWAKVFNLENEAWVLEGALEVMRQWHKFPEWRHSLDLNGFRQYVCGNIVIRDNERRFSFEDAGWDPQAISWQGFRAQMQKRFESHLRQYEKKICTLAETRGAKRAHAQYRVEHLEWLALFHCGGSSLEEILKRSPHAADKTTISKGIHRAARLIRLSVRRKHKLKKP